MDVFYYFMTDSGENRRSTNMIYICYHLLSFGRGRGRGQAIPEYTLLLVAVALSALAAMRLLGAGVLQCPALRAGAAAAAAPSNPARTVLEAGTEASGRSHTIILKGNE